MIPYRMTRWIGACCHNIIGQPLRTRSFPSHCGEVSRAVSRRDSHDDRIAKQAKVLPLCGIGLILIAKGRIANPR